MDLPDRLALFGFTRLPAGQLAVLRAIAARRDVHLFLLHPSHALWERIGELVDGAAPVRRGEDHTATVPANRLLASWGQDARELQLVLADTNGDAAADHHHPCERPRDSLLGRLQADVQADAPAPVSPLPGQPDLRAPLDPGDRSLQVHACHGRARQVEVLRDALLHLLQDDETLEPPRRGRQRSRSRRPGAGARGGGPVGPRGDGLWARGRAAAALDALARPVRPPPRRPRGATCPPGCRGEGGRRLREALRAAFSSRRAAPPRSSVRCCQYRQVRATGRTPRG